MMWTPYEIEIILHHNCSLAPFERNTAPSYWPTVKRLVDVGILRRGDIESPVETTDLGKGLVRLWCETPIPVQQFVDPRFMGGGAE
ncbi:hypothetical protein FHT87_005233 [Rhizobium sp. BK316]|uniref:hypothetical protein n=1 Tax=Rhizobium sp. BK316 TaxID=2587053 RepID=UPI00161DE8F6|nr:hypothetical protein [Rhizobium sp. BK316]MBB3411280.1 hypothetical protein [Rhizobium sp. BK316]